MDEPVREQEYLGYVISGTNSLILKERRVKAEDLLNQAAAILDEIEAFQKLLAENKETVEVRKFKKKVKVEYGALQKLAEADPDVPQTRHALRSNNVPFLAALWDATKACEGVVAIQQKFYWTPAQRLRKSKGGSGYRSGSGDAASTSKNKGSEDATHGPKNRDGMAGVTVDIVADDGAEWVKVSMATESRMLFDLAKTGLVAGDSEYSGDSGDGDNHDDGLLKQCEDMAKASREARAMYCHPKMKLMLPHMKKGCKKVVENVLEKIRDLGIVVLRRDDITRPEPIEAALMRMKVDSFKDFTDTVNIDCTCLLGLVSDLSNQLVEEEGWQHEAVRKQISEEKNLQLLPKNLWPACGSRKLVCTKEAKTRMMEIVSLIGTDSEKERTEMMMNGCKEYSCAQRIRALQILSVHRVPGGLKLPIEAVDVDIEAMEKEIGPLATAVKPELSSINQSVFFYGWWAGITTLSSNQTAAKKIENGIEANMSPDDESGPHIWQCPVPRSLIGKETTRRNYNN